MDGTPCVLVMRQYNARILVLDMSTIRHDFHFFYRHSIIVIMIMVIIILVVMLVIVNDNDHQTGHTVYCAHQFMLVFFAIRAKDIFRLN